MTSALRVGGTYSLLALVFLLSSCGGGGSGGGAYTGASITFSPTSVSFKAATPYSQRPASQTITATMTGTASGTLYVTVDENNPDVATATDIRVMGNSGQGSILPAMPATLSTGTHQGSFTVHACLNDPTCSTGQLNGSPQTISVNYEIGSSVDTDTVMPRVVPANASGTVILRGHGFTGASAVSLGTTPADSVSVVSDSEIHASYPALAAGSYPITINSGSAGYDAILSVVSTPAFSATSLPYPGSTDVSPDSISYDADRTALLVTVATSAQSAALLRYAFDGTSWGTPTQVVINNLRQVSVSPDGTKLLGLIATDLPPDVSMAEFDPLTLAETADTPITQLSLSTATVIGGFAYANDGNAIVWSIGALNSAYVFGTGSRTWSIPYNNLGQQVDPEPTVGSGDGSIVMINPNERYDASSGAFTVSATTYGALDNYTSTDLTGSEFATRSGQVIDRQGRMLGAVPAAMGVVINPAGTRLYALLQTDAEPELHTYDLTAATNGGAYPEIGTPTILAGDIGTGVYFQLAITPDGRTVFIAGPNGVAVQPVSL